MARVGVQIGKVTSGVLHLAPCRARLPGKGGPSLADMLLLLLDLGPSELYVGSSNLLVPQSLT